MAQEKRLKPYLILFVAGLLAVFGITAYRGAFRAESFRAVMAALCDGCFVTGALMLCFGGLSLTASKGAFDMLSFGVGLLFSIFSKEKRRDKDFYEYSERKKEERRKNRKGTAPLLYNGLGFLAAAMLILVGFGL